MGKRILMMIAICSFIANIAIAGINDGMVAHYMFEGNASDNSGYENHGTAYGGVIYEDGHLGLSASFDGINDYIKVLDSPSFSTNDISISFWFKARKEIFVTTGLLRNQQFISKWAKDENGNTESIYNEYAITYQQDKIRTIIKNREIMESEFTFDNNWHHVVVIYGDDRKQIFFDGINTVNELFNMHDFDSTSSIIIGGGGSDLAMPIYMFDGLLDDFRIYNRVLSESEIQELYNEVSDCYSEADIEAAKEEGRQECINDPASCGISELDYCDLNGDGETTRFDGKLWRILCNAPKK